MQIEREKMQKEYELAMYKNKTERDYKENVAKNDDRRTAIEIMQLTDGNPYNDKIMQVRH